MTTSIVNPQLPFTGSFNGSLRPFMTLHVRGFIRSYDGRCVINFNPNHNGNSTKIFHISMRPDQEAIVRNTYQHGAWGQEERDGNYHMKAYERFEITITAEQNHYRLSFNQQYFANYQHRIPLHMVQYYCISGDVTIEEIILDSGVVPPPMMTSPQTQIQSPYPIATPSVPVQWPTPIPMTVQHVETTQSPPLPSAPQQPYNPVYNLDNNLQYSMSSQGHLRGENKQQKKRKCCTIC